MKKIALIFFTPLLLCCVTLSSFAAETEYDEEYFTESLFSSMSDEAADALEELGIDSLDYEKIYNVSFSDIMDFFGKDLKTRAQNCISDTILLSAVIIITGVVNTYFLIDKKDNLVSVLGVIAVTLIMVSKTNPLINTILSTMKMNSTFMLSFIPIFTLLISLSGNPGSAVTYNSLALVFAEGISAFINNVATDLIGVFFCISIAFSLNNMMNINRFINIINKAVSFVVGFIACGFTGLLSIKGVLSSAVDGASAKSIRFLLSSLIPIVGSSISDAYSSLIGSINLIKSSVAVVGILVVLIISIPAVMEGFFYCVSYSVLSYMSEVMGSDDISGVLRAFSSGIRVLLLLSVLEIFILIISTGIMLNIKGAV